MMEEEHIYIPVDQSEEVVAVPLSNLPEDPEEIVDVLKAEMVPFSLWVDFARAYLAQDKIPQYQRLLSFGTEKDVEDFYRGKGTFESIQLLCELAATHVDAARAESNKSSKTERFAKAADLLSTARQLDFHEQLSSIGLGELALARDDIEGAKREFQQAARHRSNGKENIAGILMLAKLHFRQSQYADALKLYKMALRRHPGCPPHVRLGIAFCHFHLGRPKLAEAAFNRTIALDPHCSSAYIGLAVLSLNSGTKQGRAQGVHLLYEAFESDPSNPHLLALLSQHCLVNDCHEEARQLAAAAAELAESDKQKAKCVMLEGRAWHALRSAREAARCYTQARKLDTKLPLPHYGLAQLNLLQDQSFHTSINLLETALQQVPGWQDALQVLGQLYSKMPEKAAKSLAQFREAAARSPSSMEVWEMLAELLAATDPPGSLHAYKKALELYRAAPHSSDSAPHAAENGHTEPSIHLNPKLLNNAAVMHMRGGNFQVALELIEEAIQAAASGDAVSNVTASSQVTMGYNHARLQESCGRRREAEVSYQRILQEFPGYVDCYLRLACLQGRRGDLPAAHEWASKALAASNNAPDALAVQASLYLADKDKSQWDKAKEILEKKLLGKHENRHDAYAQLALGNLFLNSISHSAKHPGSEDRDSKQFTRALALYKRALEQNPGNLYAVNGIGAVLAEQGHLTDAHDIFGQVQEVSAASEGFFQMPEASVNLASAALAQQNFAPSAQLFQSCLRRHFHGQSSRVLLYLARAQYDANRLLDAKKTLQRAIHCSPWDTTLAFNLAVVMQEYGVRELKKERRAGDPNKLTELTAAGVQLTQAWRLFTFHKSQLDRLGKHTVPVDKKKLAAHLNFCNSTFQKAQVLVKEAEKEEEAADEVRAAAQHAIQLAAQARQAEVWAREQKAEQARLDREAAGRQQAAKMERLKQDWRDNEAARQAAEQGDASKVDRKRKKDQQAAAEEAAFIEPDDDLDGAEYQPGDESDDGQAGPADDGNEDEGEDPAGAAASLAGTGLMSDSEEAAEPAAEVNEALEPEVEVDGQEAEPAAGPSSHKGRLKRHRHPDVAAQPETAAPEDDDMDSDGPQDDGAQAAKRHRAALFQDSDDE
ncbi:hypothetical protein WJX84_004302 [Apatococcus fuscideae]|uniref:Uncharacterized protein n=1 Tax=Apatococcus fuscideae TaxID=2026836 RepID=A0AAW1SJ15_9CHLO